MLQIIHLFGFLMLIAGIVLLIKPSLVLDFISRFADSLGLYIGAIAARLVLGALLISVADLSRFPLTNTIIGWIAIVAALTFLAMGRKRFQRLLHWIMVMVKPLVRIGGVFAIGFGLFLLYAFL